MSVSTFQEVAESIGWLSGHPIEFDSADWSTVNEDGLVRLSGDYEGSRVKVVVQIKSVVLT